MTFLIVGSEEEMIESGTNVKTSTSATYNNLTYSRAALQLESRGGDATQFNLEFTSSTDIWIHFNFARGDGNANSDEDLFTIFNGLNSVYSLDFTDGVPSFAGLSLGHPFVDDTQHIIDCHVKLDAVSGVLEWFVNNNLVGRSTGDTIGGGESAMTNAIFRHPDRTGSFFDDVGFSQMIISTSPTLGMFLETTSITGEGTTSDWTGPYTNINGVTIDGGLSITTSTANDVSTYPTTNITIPNSLYVIDGLSVGARASGDGPNNMQMSVRSGTTNYFSGNVSNLFAAANIFTTDPDTGSKWTESGVNAVEIGVKAIT